MTGDWFTGSWLTGDWFTGDWFTGSWFTGSWFTGDWFTGDWFTGAACVPLVWGTTSANGGMPASGTSLAPAFAVAGPLMVRPVTSGGVADVVGKQFENADVSFVDAPVRVAVNGVPAGMPVRSAAKGADAGPGPPGIATVTNVTYVLPSPTPGASQAALLKSSTK